MSDSIKIQFEKSGGPLGDFTLIPNKVLESTSLSTHDKHIFILAEMYKIYNGTEENLKFLADQTNGELSLEEVSKCWDNIKNLEL